MLSPFSACLIDTDDGPVLVETGVNPDGRRDPAAAAGERARATKLSLREGDGEVVPGVWVISSPGHTPGHQSVLVSLPESGKMLLALDAISTRENIELETVGGVPWNAALAIGSIRRLVQLVKRENATLVPGHQPGCWSTLKRSPECYR